LFFDVGANAYTITALPGVDFGIGDDLANNSGVEQNFVSLADETSSGSFTFTQSGNDEATIIGPVTFTQQPFNAGVAFPPSVVFQMAGAGDATFHNLGASISGGIGGRTDFLYAGATADQSTIINEGATVAGASGAASAFLIDNPTAGNASLIANGGTNGGGGGSFTFEDASNGGTARTDLFGNGYLDLSEKKRPTFSIGSIEGDGQVYLGTLNCSVGANGLATTFSGVLHPGSPSGGQGSGALTKIGIGTLTLTGANLYTKGTTVTQGVLIVSNTSGSGTGTGLVSVNAGTLGGSGIIAGTVTVGTGSGSGAFLTPGFGTNKQVTLTIQSALTFNSDATYSYTFKAKQNKARTDKVIANGVTINGGTIAITSSNQNRIRRGTVLTVISNTSANPISGTFSNLPDGGIVTVNGNNFQASYAGGDGNDLTLTVVP
jgi:autotransporter-associated beta strand protein